jgi:hypothetical protein
LPLGFVLSWDPVFRGTLSVPGDPIAPETPPKRVRRMRPAATGGGNAVDIRQHRAPPPSPRRGQQRRGSLGC